MPLEGLMSRIKNNSGNLPGGFKKNCLPKISQNLKFPETALTKRSSGGGIVPKTSRDCTECGVCARQCPVQAIDLKDPSNNDKKAYLLYEVRLCLPAFGKKRKRHHAEGGKYRAEKSLLRSQGRELYLL